MKKLTKKQKKKAEKKLQSRVKKSRIKNGFGNNNCVCHSATINPSNGNEETIQFLQFHKQLIDKLDFIRKVENGIPEELDIASINVSGVNIWTLANTLLELGMRQHLYENNVLEDPLDYYDTIAIQAEGEEGFVEHISEEYHNDFIKHWEIIQEHNQKEIYSFQIAVLNATSIEDI